MKADHPQADAPYAPYRFVGHACALIVLAAVAWEFIANVRHPSDRDFLSFWAAAKMALAGTPWLAYDNGALHALQSAVATFSIAGGEMPFPYPPAYLLLVLPFGLLSFPAGLIAWSLTTMAFYLFAGRRLFPDSGWLALAFPAVFANAAIGQNAFVTAGIFMLGLALLKRRPLAAGLVLGCLAIKPQLALLLPVALLAGRQWQAIAGAATSAAGILIGGLLLFGVASTEAWLHQLPLYAQIGRDGLVGWHKLVSVYAAARQAGLDTGAALIVHGLVVLVAAGVVWPVWRCDGDVRAKAAILAAATPLASPYVFHYDGLILVPAFLWLARQTISPAIVLALWCIPLLMISQLLAAQPLNLGPVAPLALMALLLQRWREAAGSSRGAVPAL